MVTLKLPICVWSRSETRNRRLYLDYKSTKTALGGNDHMVLKDLVLRNHTGIVNSIFTGSKYLPPRSEDPNPQGVT